MLDSTPPRPPESRGILSCDRCGRPVTSADAIHVVEASIPACPEFPFGFHSEFDLCEQCFVQDELDATRYLPNCFIPGEGWREI
jgi:hypothetical protein